MTRRNLFSFMLVVVCSTTLLATETENLGTRALPAPGKVTIDGGLADWDLSSGTLACGDVENQRDAFAVWFHIMYDSRNLYLVVSMER